jgi:putative Holliday junction resolvase
LRRSTRRADVEAIRRVCAAEGVGALVVGLPRNMDGSSGPQTRRTLSFADDLRVLNLPVAFCDERLSTFMAEEYVTARRGRRPRPGERIDHVAAAIILQDFLDSSQGPGVSE